MKSKRNNTITYTKNDAICIYTENLHCEVYFLTWIEIKYFNVSEIVYQIEAIMIEALLIGIATGSMILVLTSVYPVTYM